VTPMFRGDSEKLRPREALVKAIMGHGFSRATVMTFHRIRIAVARLLHCGGVWYSASSRNRMLESGTER
jgi:hypothetical protein